MRNLIVLALLPILFSCVQEEKDAVKWVDVDLSDNTFFENSAPYRQGEYQVLVLGESAREFKLGISEGDSVVYDWQVDMTDPALLSVEFHGHTIRVDDEPGDVMFYKKHNDGKEAGTLVAPFDGIHGWYLKNDSTENTTLNLTVSGFYEELSER